MCAGILFRVSRRPYTKHRTSNDVTAPHTGQGPTADDSYSATDENIMN